MDSFSDEILLIILSRVPTLELTRLQYVCKRWKSIVKEPFFRQLHYSRSMSNPKDNQFLMIRLDQKLLFRSLTDKTRYLQTRLIGHLTPEEIQTRRLRSDNGLLLFCDGALRSIFIMNPFTNQSMLLPRPDSIWSEYDLRACGFAFDPTKNLYKVVIVVKDQSSQSSVFPRTHYQLLLLDNRSTKWRSVGWINYFIRDRSQVLVNGRLHWMANKKIVSLELDNEKLSLIEPPNHLIHFLCSGYYSLVVFGGYLCMVCHLYSCKTLDLQIWVMKEYGVEESWVKEFDKKYVVPSHMGRATTNVTAVGEVDGKILLRFDAYKTGSVAFMCEPRRRRHKFVRWEEMQMSPGWENGIIYSVHNANLNWVEP